MSYSIAVVVKDGKAEVDPVGTTPELLADGRYVISGHVPSEGTWQAEHIQVTRFAPDATNVVITASGTHYV